MRLPKLTASLAVLALGFSSGCSMCHKQQCGAPPPRVSAAPPPCCGVPGPGAVAVPAGPGAAVPEAGFAAPPAAVPSYSNPPSFGAGFKP